MQITAAADLVSGALVIVGNTAAVCIHNIADTKTGTAAIEGVWELPKDAAAADKALAQGAKVYWNATTGKVEAAAGAGLVAIGIAYEAALTNATTCLVKINVGI